MNLRMDVSLFAKTIAGISGGIARNLQMTLGRADVSAVSLRSFLKLS